MKKFFSAVVVVVAIIFSAFSQPKTIIPLNGELWFGLKAGGNSMVAADYQLIGDGSTQPDCEGSHVCAKLAVPSSGNAAIPDLSTTIDTRFRPNP